MDERGEQTAREIQVTRERRQKHAAAKSVKYFQNFFLSISDKNLAILPDFFDKYRFLCSEAAAESEAERVGGAGEGVEGAADSAAERGDSGETEVAGEREEKWRGRRQVEDRLRGSQATVRRTVCPTVQTHETGHKLPFRLIFAHKTFCYIFPYFVHGFFTLFTSSAEMIYFGDFSYLFASLSVVEDAFTTGKNFISRVLLLNFLFSFIYFPKNHRFYNFSKISVRF